MPEREVERPNRDNSKIFAPDAIGLPFAGHVLPGDAGRLASRKRNMRTADTKATRRNASSRTTGGKSGGIRTEAGTLRERWRICVERELAAIDGNGCYVPAAIIEEAEGRPMADVITDHICRLHGYGVADPTPEQINNREIDAWYENKATDRARRNHIAETARQETFHCMLMLAPMHRGLMTDAQLRTFVSRFYRRGDYGLGPAVCRALLASVG